MPSYVDLVRPLRLPADLVGVANGRLPAGLLRPCRAGDVAHHFASRAHDAMFAAAYGDGIDLSVTDGYRSYEAQAELFESRYSRWGFGGGCKTCPGYKRMCKKHAGLATAACPGTSNHGWGLAFDQYAVTQADRLSWLENHAWEFGFGWELVPEEPWHVRYCTAEAIPAAVLEYEKQQQQPAPEPLMFGKDDPMVIVDLSNRTRRVLVEGGWCFAVNGGAITLDPSTPVAYVSTERLDKIIGVHTFVGTYHG